MVTQGHRAAGFHGIVSMGAVFGFTGPPDHALFTAMRQSLTHRGSIFDGVESRNGSVGCLASVNEAPRDEYASGWYKNPAVDPRHSQQTTNAGQRVKAVAISGFLTSHTSPSFDILAEVQRCQNGDIREVPWDGDFVAAILTEDKIHLLRDPAGTRSVYFARHNNRHVFASEPKAIWSLPGFSRQISLPAIAQYFAFSFVPDAATMLKGIVALPAGHSVCLSDVVPCEPRRYFFFERDECDYDHGSISHGDVTSWIEGFRDRFTRSVQQRIPQSMEPLVFLSGGLDSSVVTAEVAQHVPQLKTYALHFGRTYPNELEFAAEVAQRCNTRHSEFLIQPKDFLPDLRRMIWHLDDPIGDPITMPNFQLARHAAERSPWIFNGEGGDPCFGGPKNLPMMLTHWYGGLNREPNFRQREYLASYRRGYEELSYLLTDGIQRQIRFDHALENVLTPYFDCDRPRSFLNKLTAINIRLKGAQLILPKVERMLAAAGAAPLSPLFSADMIRLSFQIPNQLKLHGGVEKIILKRAFADRLPDRVIRRPKSGMRVPVHYWFQGELRRYAKKILNRRDTRQAGIFRYDRVKQLLDYNIEEGPGRYGIRLWMLLTFEIWRRIVIDNEPI